MKQTVSATDSARLKELARAVRSGGWLTVGRALIEAKAILPHGQWLPWLREFFPGSPRRAQQLIASFDSRLAELKVFNRKQFEISRHLAVSLEISHLRRICKKRPNTKSTTQDQYGRCKSRS